MSARKKRSNKEQDLIIEAFINILTNDPSDPEEISSVIDELDSIKN